MDGASMLSTFCDPEYAEEGGGGGERSLGKQKSSDVYSLNQLIWLNNIARRQRR